MDSTPIVGVVILNYNQSGYTIECIKSLIENETYKNYCIVVVDNNSPDQKQRLILEQHVPSSIHVIFSNHNGGYAAGNNIGAKYLVQIYHVQYVFILNNDSLIFKPVIQSLVDSINKDVDYAAVSPLVLSQTNMHNWERLVQVRRLPGLFDMIICNTSLLKNFFTKRVKRYLYVDIMPYKRGNYTVETINGAAFMIRTEVLKEIGYLDERTFLYYEELILGLQLRQLNKKCILNTSSEIVHFQGISTNSNERSYPYKMFKYHLQSFNFLLKEYYDASRITTTMFSFYRHFEYGLKIVTLWLTKKFYCLF